MRDDHRSNQADVVCCLCGQREERGWFQRIARYHVDFVLCDHGTTAPLLVIELDDRRHREGARKALDAFKDDVLRAAGLPVLRVTARASYSTSELARQIDAILRGR